MRIIRKSDSIFAEKPDGTQVNYYMMPEYEIHLNSVPPGCTQVWHSHEKVEEALMILEGKLTALWMDESGTQREDEVSAGDLVMVQDTEHTFQNRSAQVCKFIVVKLVLHGVNNQSIFKTDKKLRQTPAIK